MTQGIYAFATLCTALATLVTAIASAWIGIASRAKLSAKIQAVHSATEDTHMDIAQVKRDVFSMTGVLTQQVNLKEINHGTPS